MGEDQAQGVDAEFTVNVDGQQIGGVQSVTANQQAGQTEGFTFEGDWGPGQHDVTVTFVNNFLYPGSGGDRNAYVDGVTYDGQTVSTTTMPLYQSPLYSPNSTAGEIDGSATYTVNDTTPIPPGASDSTTSPAPVTVGSGADTLVLNVAEDPFQGDAQFVVTVDGQQVGGVQTTSAVVSEGQFQEFDVKGNFGGGTHNVGVTFLNDAVGGFYPPGTPGLPPGTWALDTEDRNLYVMGASLDGGAPASGLPWEQSSDGTTTFSVTAGNNSSATAYNSGLFATNGAATTSGNAAIPAGSAAPGMSFISSATATATPAATGATATASDPSSTSSTDTLSSTLSGTAAPAPTPTATVADPTTTAVAASTDPATSTAGSAATWLSHHPNAGAYNGAFHSHG